MAHIGVIPSRKGSKRLKNKNNQLLGGIRLWLIQHIKSRLCLDRTYINTDDEEIIKFSLGIKPTVYRRPENLTDGTSYRIDDVMLEMANTLEFDDNDVMHLLQPTNPFLKEENIGYVRRFNWNEIDSAQAVTEIDNIYHEYSQREIIDGKVLFCHEKERNEHFNSQLKPKRYAFGGYVAFKVGSLRKYGNIWGKISMPIVISKLEAFDIDTEEDLEIARSIVTAGIKI